MTRPIDNPLTAGAQVRPGRAEQPWLIYRIARWATLAARLVVVWWPLAPIWITALVFPPAAIALVVTYLIVGLVPVGRLAPARRWLRARLVDSVRGSYEWGWRLLWHRVCGLAGLTYVLAHRARVPELVRVTAGPRLRWTTLVVRPLGTHDPASWDTMADRFRRVTKHATSMWWQDGDGSLVIRLFRRPLPDLLPIRPDHLSGHEDQIVLGESAEGDPIRWHVDARPHATVVGVTGGGKGVLVRLVLAHAVVHGWAIRVLNPKRSGEYTWLRDRASIAHTLAGMAAMIRATHAEMMRRQDLIQHAGADTWHHVEDLNGRVLLVLDESASLIGTGNRGADAPLRRELAGLIASIVAMGRSAGVHVVILTQHPVADSFGPSGSTVKTNTAARIVVGSSPPEGLRMMFGPDLDPSTQQALSAQRPGRCLYQGADPTKGARVTVGQIYLATQADLAPLAAATPITGPVVDFDHLAQDIPDDGEGDAA